MPNVEAYIADLKARVRSVTVYNCIHQLRRAAQLLAPTFDFSWLAEIEKDLALAMKPRSKFDRLVLTGQLVEAGLTLVAEAQEFATIDLARGRRVRNGLLVALLALCPIRLKNFAALEIGETFKEGSRKVVDRLARQHDEISPAGRASRPGMVEPLH